ncbi:hypothetical protein [Streptomyces sp. NPDC020681]|uniref:hypothetical protein n=1 Tax=Streptomyces sp. NPDC020681 TaxID=3365083 RepID=UPI003788B6CD
MSTRPNTPHAARRARLRLVVGAQKGVAQGVPIAVRPDPQTDDGRRPVAELHIVAPPDWSVTPSARSWCSCGRERNASGRAAVLGLAADYAEHRDICHELYRIEEGGMAV